MDTKRFLLAEHYDSLGLFKIADSLDRYDLANQSKTKKNKSQVETPQNQQPDMIERGLVKLEPAFKAVEPVLGPMSVVFSISEINNLSKQALDMHALQKLTEISKSGIVKPSQTKYLQTLANNSKIAPEISQLLKQAINNQLPTIKAINALKPQMPNIGGSAKNFISNMKAYALKNPAQAEIAENVTKELGKKVGIFKTIGKTVPIAFVFLNAMMLYPEAKNYFLKINAGDIDEIFGQPDTRAKFCIFLADVISFFTSFFPPLAPVTSALIAISTGYQAGMYAFDKYRELSGEKEKEELESKFTSQEYGPSRKKSLFDKYKDNLFDNLRLLIWEYTDSQIENSEVKYAIRVLLYPEILRLIDKAISEKKEYLGLKISDIMRLPVFTTGKAISETLDKNGKYKQRQLAVPDFMINPTDPKNLAAFHDFRTAIIYIANDVNIAYKQLMTPRKKK